MNTEQVFESCFSIRECPHVVEVAVDRVLLIKDFPVIPREVLDVLSKIGAGVSISPCQGKAEPVIRVPVEIGEYNVGHLMRME